MRQSFGIPHSDFGEQVAAVVQLQPGMAPSEELAQELINHCREHLSHTKCPRLVDFARELPRTETGNS
jgi:fatty-acyl-CoA synthase